MAVEASRNTAKPPAGTLPAVSTFLGESSFDIQTAQASLTAEVSARDVHANGTGTQIRASLQLLQSFMRQSSASSLDALSFPLAEPTTANIKLELPPLDIVLAALRRASGMYSEAGLGLC